MMIDNCELILTYFYNIFSPLECNNDTSNELTIMLRLYGVCTDMYIL